MPYNYPCQQTKSHLASRHCFKCQAIESDSIAKLRWGGSSEPHVIYQVFFSPNAVKDCNVSVPSVSPVWPAIFHRRRV
jgi:hypothetical protein